MDCVGPTSLTGRPANTTWTALLLSMLFSTHNIALVSLIAMKWCPRRSEIGCTFDITSGILKTGSRGSFDDKSLFNEPLCTYLCASAYRANNLSRSSGGGFTASTLWFLGWPGIVGTIVER